MGGFPAANLRMIDIAGLTGTPTASDFIFRVGTTGDPSTWAAAPTPSAISVRSGAGVNGSSRVEVTWADGSIENEWLQVTVKADSVTGLAGADVFYWGNKQGDATGDGIDNSADLQQVLADNTGPWPVTKSDDFNKDTFVNSADLQIVNFYSNTLIPMITTPVQARSYYATSYYDAADRSTDQVNVGTNGGTPYTRPASVPTGTNQILVTHTDYDNGGRVLDTVDPRGIKQGNFYDLLGNTLDTIAAWDGTGSASSLPTVGNASNQITQYAYDGNGDVLSMTAMQPAGGSTPNQTTGYDYGVNTGTGGGIGSGSAINSNDLLAAVLYPDPSNGKAGGVDPGQSPVMSDVVLNAYDLQGETTQMTDRDGNVHGYTYDVLGRLKLDSVTTLGSGVDGSIRALGYNYTALGLPYQQTSYSNAAGTTVVNQVEDVYNGYGQLITQYQEHSGAVNTGSSLKLQYGYSQPSGANYSRLSTITYPNTRVLDYVYNSGLDGDISRVSGISDASGTGAGNDQSYLYLGLDTIVQATDGNGTALSYIKQPGESSAPTDGGDQYTGLDRFGRVDDQNWVNLSTGVSTDRFQYGYDADGNVLYKNNLVNSSFSELYHANGVATNSSYDNLNRLTNFARGTLSSSGNNGTTLDQVTSPSTTNNWNLDAVGNWTATGSQTRTFNAQNQITGISGLTTPTYDNNGNMTKDQAGNTYTFNAWNQIAKVNGAYTYTYDALGRRVYEGTTGRDLYYDASNGNVIEERQGSTVTDQNVWGLMYVNQLVLRDDNSTTGSYGLTGSGLGERLYAQQDANWNVTSLVNTSGAVQERFVYDPYGTRTVLNASWGSASDSLNCAYGYQDGRTDPVDGLVHFDVRDLNTVTGTWVQQDPNGSPIVAAPSLATDSPATYAASQTSNLQARAAVAPILAQYIDGLSLYRFEVTNPIRSADPTGEIAVFLSGATRSYGDQYNSGVGKMYADPWFANNVPGGRLCATYRQVDWAIDAIKRAKAANPNEPVILVGHSWGGGSANYVAQQLADAGINVDLEFTIDPVTSLVPTGPDNMTIPSNVNNAVNIYNPNAGSVGGGQVNGAVNIPLPNTTHVTISDDPRTANILKSALFWLMHVLNEKKMPGYRPPACSCGTAPD